MAPKRLSTLAPEILVNASGITILTSSSLNYVSDVPGATQPIRYQGLTLSPSIGSIAIGGSNVTQFTQAQLSSGVVNYVSDPNNKLVLTVLLKGTIYDPNDNKSIPLSYTLRYTIPDARQLVR